jgi:hypothetical protein
MSRGLGVNERLLLAALENYPQHLISTRVLCWFLMDGDSDSYGTSLAKYRKWEGEWPNPWTRHDDINVCRSLRGLQRKGLVKCWGRDYLIRFPDGSHVGNKNSQQFWSALTCEGSNKCVLA